MTTNDLAEAERRIIHQTREQAIAEIGADRYNQLITVFVEAHKNDPGTIGNPVVIDDLLHPDHGVHPDEWTGEGITAMLAANPEPPAWYEQQPPAASTAPDPSNTERRRCPYCCTSNDGRAIPIVGGEYVIHLTGAGGRCSGSLKSLRALPPLDATDAEPAAS